MDLKHSKNMAGLSIVSNTVVVTLKLVVGIMTGSVAIVSEAIHSSLDLVASVIAFISVRLSNNPPDEKHPYGHGKIENISGTIETILIMVAGIWIIQESIAKLKHPEPIELPMLGIGVMLLGALINFIVGKKIQKVGEATNSVAMKSNGLHLLTDVYSSLGVAVSLLLVTLTDWLILDPLIGIAIAIYIIWEAIGLGKESFLPLVDIRLSDEEEEGIKKIIEKYGNQFIEYHHFRTRRSGADEHVDFHLVFPIQTSLDEAHRVSHAIKNDIQEQFPKSEVLIHLEPETSAKTSEGYVVE